MSGWGGLSPSPPAKKNLLSLFLLKKTRTSKDILQKARNLLSAEPFKKYIISRKKKERSQKAGNILGGHFGPEKNI